MEKAITKKIKTNPGWLKAARKQILLLLSKRKIVKQKSTTKTYNDYFISLIHKAKIELEQSKNFFANVSDPDLVDYAAHKILANQSFYAYLLKKAKAENITFDV